MDYGIALHHGLEGIPANAWNELLAQQATWSPFMRHEYLDAMHASASACDDTGWTPQYVTLWAGDELAAAAPLYIKHHSYGEYVFDWAWANAYQQHGLDYYPKGLVAIPFTPVPGPRLMARCEQARKALIEALLATAQNQNLSSLHILFATENELQACQEAGMMRRQTVQFHWEDDAPPATFEDFLSSLRQAKRKKIRQERRKVEEAGVRFSVHEGSEITETDWAFFYRCYRQTYLEHGNPPYLSPDFFERMRTTMPENWVLFIADIDGERVAASLIAIDPVNRVAYGRYWGSLAAISCLHFEACYYQPLQWCMGNGYKRFEGGAQGEHKMARALMPVMTGSAHWLAHPAFADAVERFLEREGEGVDMYLEALQKRSPMRERHIGD
ncbi:GNAT family N-acetyltransferase [Hydrogenophaga sp. 5NK40-0174]|uniref:GNAT family N-acetyltransferase n=1 Tax=Hydrogenophaga sp. 5NK40-0174 TaxID=3127649 RepID=UPI0031095CDD